MPLAADPKGGGTEADGSISPDYCSFCYQNGAFTTPGVTLEQFVERLQGIMAETNIPEDAAQEALAALPHLKRWRKT